MQGIFPTPAAEKPKPVEPVAETDRGTQQRLPGVKVVGKIDLDNLKCQAASSKACRGTKSARTGC
jgi:translation initiation factor IF-2